MVSLLSFAGAWIGLRLRLSDCGCSSYTRPSPYSGVPMTLGWACWPVSESLSTWSVQSSTRPLKCKDTGGSWKDIMPAISTLKACFTTLATSTISGIWSCLRLCIADRPCRRLGNTGDNDARAEPGSLSGIALRSRVPWLGRTHTPFGTLAVLMKVVVQRKFEEWRNAQNHQAEKLAFSTMKEFQ